MDTTEKIEPGKNRISCQERNALLMQGMELLNIINYINKNAVNDYIHIIKIYISKNKINKKLEL